MSFIKNYEETIKNLTSKNLSQESLILTANEIIENHANDLTSFLTKIESLTSSNNEYKEMMNSIVENENELRIQVSKLLESESKYSNDTKKLNQDLKEQIELTHSLNLEHSKNLEQVKHECSNKNIMKFRSATGLYKRKM